MNERERIVVNLHTTQAVFLTGLCAYAVIRAVYQHKAKALGAPRSSRSTLQDKALICLVMAGQVALPLIYVFTPWLDGSSYSPAAGSLYVGAMLWAVGLWMFWRAHADLGSNWSVTLEIRHGHELIQQGVYRYIRHPMYSSFLILGAAQAALLPNWVAGMSAFVTVAALCMVRIPQEEAMLCDVFGNEYRRYIRTTGGVMPWAPRRTL